MADEWKIQSRELGTYSQRVVEGVILRAALQHAYQERSADDLSPLECAALDFLLAHAPARNVGLRAMLVLRLTHGFETPYGLALLVEAYCAATDIPVPAVVATPYSNAEHRACARETLVAQHWV